MPDCIIPAAGRSRRMRGWKPGLPWGDVTMVEKVISEAVAAGCRVIVTGGFRFFRLTRILENYNDSDNGDNCNDVILVRARSWRKGMDVSIRSALNEISSDRFFIVPADMPLIKSDDYRRLANIDAAMVIRPSFAGKRGHPVLLDSKIALDLRMSPSGTPVRTVLEKYKTITVPWGHEGVIRDFDTRSEYAAFKP